MKSLTGQLSRERLEKLASGDAFTCIQDDEGAALARALLAVMDAKPIGVVVELASGLVLDGTIHTEPRMMRSVSGLSAMKRQPVGTRFFTTPPAPIAPNGWKVVPVEPDWNMLSADGCKKHHEGKQCSHHDNRRRIWQAMLAASPAPGE